MAHKTDSMTLDMNVVSARGLTEVDHTSNMKIYALVSVTGTAAQNEQKAQTNVDREGGGNPTWNLPVKFAVVGCSYLVFALKCEDRITGDRDVGEVHVSVADLLHSAGDGNSMRYVAVSYPVRKPSGQMAGVLNFEYKFGGSPMIDMPGYATRSVRTEIYPPPGYYYPPPPPAAGYGRYPPPPQPYSPYPPPSPSHYMPPQPYPPYNVGRSVAPPPYPYAYPPHQSHVHARAPPVVPEKRSKSKKKSGWGGSALGLVGALAVGAITGGSAPVPDTSNFTSEVQIPDPSAYAAPPDFSNFYPLPDPSTLMDTTYVDYSSLV